MLSKADKMFDELGYKKTRDNEEIETYILGDFKSDVFNEITFYLDQKTYEAFTYNYLGVTNSYYVEKGIDLETDNFNLITDIKTHLAIHEKMKELGWLDE